MLTMSEVSPRCCSAREFRNGHPKSRSFDPVVDDGLVDDFAVGRLRGALVGELILGGVEGEGEIVAVWVMWATRPKVGKLCPVRGRSAMEKWRTQRGGWSVASGGDRSPSF